MERETIGEFQKIFNNFNDGKYILGDPKQEGVFIGFTVNKGKVIFDSFNKNNCSKRNSKSIIGKLGKGKQLRICSTQCSNRKFE